MSSSRTKSSGVGEARASVGVARLEPPAADHGDEDLAPAQHLLEDLDEVHARLDAVDVDEHAPRTERGHEGVVEPAGRGRLVLAPVADEDGRHATGRV